MRLVGPSTCGKEEKEGEPMQNSQTITLRLPDTLYQQVQNRAQRLHRSIEGEVVALLSATLPTLDDLPAPIADEMAQLHFLPTPELWRVARNKLSPADNERMQELAFKRQRMGLSRSEEDEVEALHARYERTLLLRAQAMALLKERGHDVSELLPVSPQ